MRRREFIGLFSGTVAWPLVAHAQQPKRMQRIVVLMGTANDADAHARAVALQQGLQVLAWTPGHNIEIEYKFAAGDAQRMATYVKEAVSSAPDLILAQTNPALKASATQHRPCRSCFCKFPTPSVEALLQV